MTEIIVPSILTAITIIVPAWWIHKRETKKIKNQITLKQMELEQAEERILVNIKKAEYLPRIMTLRNTSNITHAVQEIFSKTKASRFLILIGVNGKYDLNSVSCVWYLYKDPEKDLDPIKNYAQVDITEDIFYKSMLKEVSTYTHRYKDIDTLHMPKSLLKDIYYEEEVRFTKVGFLNRDAIDDDNDFLAFFSISTDEDEPFTDREKSIIKRVVDAQIKTNLTSIFD